MTATKATIITPPRRWLIPILLLVLPLPSRPQPINTNATTTTSIGNTTLAMKGVHLRVGMVVEAPLVIRKHVEGDPSRPHNADYEGE